MKKPMKKLVLAKETVRNLEDAELGAIAGGWTTSCASIQAVCKHPPTLDC